MQLTAFSSLVSLSELTEVNKAKYICFYQLKENSISSFSMTFISECFESFGFSKPNTSRLKTNLLNSKVMKISKTQKNTLEFIPIHLQQLELDYGKNWIDSETIISNNELIDEVKFCGKRGFIDKLIKQINHTYADNCYDACAVLLRRLFEVILVLCFQKNGIEAEITQSGGNHLMLEGIVKKAIGNKVLNIPKRITDNFEAFREVGNNSAHSITYTAGKKDIDDISRNYRVMLEDLYNKAGLI